MSIFSLEPVLFGPVRGSCLSATGSQRFGASRLAVLLLSVCACRQVVLDKGLGSFGHSLGGDTVRSVGAIAGHGGLLRKTLSAIRLLASSGVGSIADREVVLGKSTSSSTASSDGTVGSIADGELVSEGSSSAGNTRLSIGSIADGLLLGKSSSSSGFNAASCVGSVADRKVVSAS